MGKKKSTTPAVKMERPKLETVFPCPLCGGHNTVTCKFDREQKLGTVTCSECNGMYQIDDCSALHEAIDVYASWIDACEEANV
jgi:transcription elongation factor Elf1